MLSESRDAHCSPCIGGQCPEKDGLAWSPVTLKYGLGRGLWRQAKNVTSVNYAVVDLDHIKKEQLSVIRQSINGLRYILHTTHSNRQEKDDHCYRLVLDLSRPVTPSRS